MRLCKMPGLPVHLGHNSNTVTVSDNLSEKLITDNIAVAKRLLSPNSKLLSSVWQRDDSYRHDKFYDILIVTNLHLDLQFP